jgi:hypothetical protein
MRAWNIFTPSVALVLVAGVGPSRRAVAADEKEACLSAADQGQSLRDEGKYSGAREQFLICSRSICPKLVHDQCTDWLRQIDESIPTVVFVVKDDKGNEVTAVHVIADGKQLTVVADGRPIALDPGPHEIRFERDNPSQSAGVQIVLRAGEKNREVSVAFPSLEAPSPERPPEISPPPPAPVVAVAPERVPETRPAPAAVSNARTIASLSLVSAGAVGAGLGAYFGIESQNEANQGNSTAKALGYGACGAAGNPADPRCKSLSDSRDAQNRDAVLNIVFYSVGAALAAGAVAAWVFWPKPAGEKASVTWIAPAVGSSGAGASVGGTF